MSIVVVWHSSHERPLAVVSLMQKVVTVSSPGDSVVEAWTTARFDRRVLTRALLVCMLLACGTAPPVAETGGAESDEVPVAQFAWSPAPRWHGPDAGALTPPDANLTAAPEPLEPSAMEPLGGGIYGRNDGRCVKFGVSRRGHGHAHGELVPCPGPLDAAQPP